jgi:fructokinase
MPHLLTSLGEILIDFLPITEGGATVGFRMHPGGSPFNVAMGTARLGQPTAFAGKVSADFFGRVLRAAVEREGIDTRFLLSSDAPTTLAFVANERGDAVFTFYGERAADTLLTPGDLPEALFAETAALHVGSISLLRGTTPEAVEAAAARLHRRALISLDPNIRPGLVRDESSYRARLARLIALADLVKISAADLAWLLPGLPPEAAAAELLAQGPELVVVTQGGKGAFALRAATREAHAVAGFMVHVADAVGAGDTFNAGLLAGLAERGALSRAALAALPAGELVGVLRLAAAAAALNCTRPGADPPRRAEVAAFLGE